jgi:HK97 family phage prohead protease
MPDTTQAEASDELVTLGITLRSIDEAARTVDFIASTDAVDTYDEIVDQGTWELDIYRANPVVLFAHKSRELPIGKSVDVAVRNGRLECRIQFATEDMNPEAERVWKLIKGQFLRAVSVGFIPRDVRWEKRDGKDVFVLYNNSLREISVTPVPANHEALAKMRARALAGRPANEAPRAQENDMDEKTKQELEAQLAAATKAIEEAKAKRAEELAAKTAELDAKLGELATAAKALETLQAKATELAAERDALVVERDALAKEKADLHAKMTEAEVDALVGDKITPAQKDDFLALARESRARFDAIVKGLPSLGLLSKAPVIDPKKGTEPAQAGDLGALLLSTPAPGESGEPADLADLL